MKHSPIPLPQAAAEAINLSELHERARLLGLLQRVTERANTTDGLIAALSYALGEICCEMGWDFGNAYLCQAMQEMVACDCWHANDDPRLAPFVESMRRARYVRGQFLPGRVLAASRAHCYEDLEEARECPRAVFALDCGLKSAAAFPIMVGSEVVVVMEFFSRTPIRENSPAAHTVAQICGQIACVAERERAREALLRDALHDALTTLPNRVLLHDRAANAFARLPADRQGLAVLVIDLDGFKAVNDKLGHHAGDCVLVATAARLRDALDEAVGGQSVVRDPLDAIPGYRADAMRATLSRTGGDEFVVLLENLKQRGDARAIAERLHEEFALPFSVGHDEVSVGASIGIAFSKASYADYDQIQRDADLAMYHAKAAGRGKTVIFTPALGQAMRARMALERDMREALDRGQFLIMYQPILDLDDARIMGFEALLRWDHPRRHRLGPHEFIPVAEETGLIVPIGEWVLNEACAAISRLHAQMPGPDLPFIAVNIAPQQLLQSGFTTQIAEALERTGLAAEHLKLEITEGVAVIDAERTRRVLERCRKMGVRIGLDDFGTGYSSLSYLHSLPFDTIKIDRAFIAAMDQPKSRKIVRTILDLASNLDLTVVAEGIETDTQRIALSSMGCTLGQGFLLSHPLEEADAFALIHQPIRACA